MTSRYDPRNDGRDTRDYDMERRSYPVSPDSMRATRHGPAHTTVGSHSRTSESPLATPQLADAKRRRKEREEIQTHPHSQGHPPPPRTTFGYMSSVMCISCVPFLPSADTERQSLSPLQEAMKPMTDDAAPLEMCSTADAVYVPRSWVETPPPVHALRHRGAVAAPPETSERLDAVNYGGVFPSQRMF